MIIYAIEESEGEYDSYCYWINRAFNSKKDAEAYIEKYNSILFKLKHFYHVAIGMDKLDSRYRIYIRKYWKYRDMWPCDIKEIELI